MKHQKELAVVKPSALSLDHFKCAVAMPVLMYFGEIWLIATTLFTVLQKAQHKIKTGYGVLALTYSNKDILIAGIGQDNRLGPTVWVSYIII